MKLVILAAGHGRRFGGLKQLAPVGPNGEAIMDYTAAAAHACGFDGVVLIVRSEIADTIAAHVEEAWPTELNVEIVCQPPTPGTAQAVLSAKEAIDGPFGVANADDLYGTDALGALAGYLSNGSPACDGHLLVTYRLTQTVLTSAPVTRGLCEITADGMLSAIVEHTVTLREDGYFDAVALDDHEPCQVRTSRMIFGTEPVSMNLWGFAPRILDDLEAAISGFNPDNSAKRELLLPDVVERLICTERERVHVVETRERCIGITHPEDIAIVSDELALATDLRPAVRTARQR